MKSNFPFFLFLLVISLLLGGCGNQSTTNSENKSPEEGSISISGAFALYPLAVKWAEDYQKLHPGVRIDISAGGAGKGITDVLSGMVDIGMVSRELGREEIIKGAFPVVVAGDAVVATINKNNKYLDILMQKGLKKSDFEKIFLSGKPITWNELINSSAGEKVGVFTRSDACGAGEIWGSFLGKNQEALKGVGVFGDPGMADAIKKDQWSIGYNNIVYAYDSRTRKPFSNIAVVPLDLNNNGKIDSEENYYGSLDTLMNAIKTGKYPSPPSRSLYFVTKGKPQNPVLLAFLNWVLTEGQKYTREAGFVELSDEKLKGIKQKLI